MTKLLYTDSDTVRNQHEQEQRRIYAPFVLAAKLSWLVGILIVIFVFITR
jgi:hypothetical protein